MANEVKYLNSISDLALNNNTYADVVIVKDNDRTSGNPFVWKSSGTANGGTVYNGSSGVWEMQFSGAVNVKWFGAVGNGSTDDSSAFIAALAVNRHIYVPKGTYLVNLNITSRYFRIEGDFDNHYSSTSPQVASILKPYTTSSPVISYNYPDPKWDYITISDIAFMSDSQTGIGFTIPSTTNYIAGRVEFNRCKFLGFDKGIYKQYGNIGFALNYCSLEENNYGFYARGYNGTPVYMHAGCNHFTGCHIEKNHLSAVHILDDNNGQGQHTFINCVFEYNYGFAAFFDTVQTGQPTESMHMPICFMNTWFEANGYTTPGGSTTSTVTVDTLSGSATFTGTIPADAEALHTFYTSPSAKKNTVVIGRQQQMAIGRPTINTAPSFATTCEPNGSAFSAQCDVLAVTDPAKNFPYQLCDENGNYIGGVFAENQTSGDYFIGLEKGNVLGATSMTLQDSWAVFSRSLKIQDYDSLGSASLMGVNFDHTAYIPMQFFGLWYKFWTGPAEFVNTVETQAHVFKTIGTSAPTTTDLPTGTYQVFKDSTGNLKLWANDGGTMKSVTLV